MMMALLQVQLMVVIFKTVYTDNASQSWTPGDDSLYVEGESRYIWMPDGDGIPRLVDLEAEDHSRGSAADGSHNKYLLFTRYQPQGRAEYLEYENATSIIMTNYMPNNPVRVIIHGWCSDASSYTSTLLSSSYQFTKDVNVIVVDWSKVANNIFYTTVVRQVPSIGEHLGKFLVWLMKVTKGNLGDVHVVGHSLGAHVAGVAGSTAGGRIGRITGLDPAGPTWRNNPNKLNSSTAVYVETINTDGKRLGIFEPLGHANFYPNGGRNAQPGCWLNPCSHTRAAQLFAATLYTDHLVGRSCSSLDDAENNACKGDKLLNMGNDDIKKDGSGVFSLSTGKVWPF